jgi:hypothetical protein
MTRRSLPPRFDDAPSTVATGAGAERPTRSIGAIDAYRPHHPMSWGLDVMPTSTEPIGSTVVDRSLRDRPPVVFANRGQRSAAAVVAVPPLHRRCRRR